MLTPNGQRCRKCLGVKCVRDLSVCQSCSRATQYRLTSYTRVGFRDLPKPLLSQEVQPLLTPHPASGVNPYYRGLRFEIHVMQGSIVSS